MGVSKIFEVFNENYYKDIDGGILEAFSKMFHDNVKVFLYPISDKKGNIINSNNLKLHPRMKDFYKFFKYNKKFIDITDYEKEFLNIFSRVILKEIKDKKNENWKNKLPDGISEIITKNNMFGYK